MVKSPFSNVINVYVALPLGSVMFIRIGTRETPPLSLDSLPLRAISDDFPVSMLTNIVDEDAVNDRVVDIFLTSRDTVILWLSVWSASPAKEA